MNTQTTPVKVETPYGALYVAVAAADRRSYYDAERGDVTELRPEVWVASDPDFQGDPGAERHWVIRGRAYAVHYHVIFQERGRYGRWHRDGYTPHRGGFRNDRRNVVEFGTKTFDLMWDALTTALDDFAASHSGWEDLSRYLLHSNEANAAESRAADARREAEKQEAIAADLRAQAGCIAATLPAKVDSLSLL